MFTYRLDDDLRLEFPELRHAEAAAKVVRENLAHLKPWMSWAVDDYSVEHAREWIQRSLDEFARDGRFGALIILGDEIIGSIGFHDLDATNKNAAIGYWIDHRHQGKGIVTRSVRALIDHLFDRMGLNRLQINCNVENTRSRAIPERLGFSLEGTLREREFVDGEFRDWAVYGLLKREWHANRL